jgi:SAM-dependent methyltransferase
VSDASRAFDPSRRDRLTEHDLGRFDGGTLFDELGRVLCGAGCLPRKELFESWEVARRVRRKLRGGRVVDLACGHGLLAITMLLLDDTSASAVAVDKRLPKSAKLVLDAVTERWPRLRDRVELVQGDIKSVPLGADDVVVSAHACGALTDVVLARATEAGAAVAVLPCCHPLDDEDAQRYPGWLDGALTLDVRRAMRMEQAGYEVFTRTIPEEITPKNRLLVARRASPATTNSP